MAISRRSSAYESYRRIRNTLRFLLTADFDPAKHLAAPGKVGSTATRSR